jgi:hypothetical protein
MDTALAHKNFQECVAPSCPQAATFSSFPIRLQAACMATLLCAAFLLGGCSSVNNLQSIAITPAAGTQVLSAKGQTAQFHAVGTYEQGQRPVTTQDVSSIVTWTSLNTAAATVSSSGLVTAVGTGSATINASSSDAKNVITASSDVTVNITTSTVPPAPVLTGITILPGTQPNTAIGETTQFIAVGAYSGSPATQDVTSLVKWSSSDVLVATVDGVGLATANGNGMTTITALATTSAGVVITATSILNVNVITNPGTVKLPTVGIYKVGPNANLGEVKASYILSGTTTPITPIDCSANASGALCTGNFPVGAVVTFTAIPPVGVIFGGWSSTCPAAPGISDPKVCQITLTVPASGTIGNVAVGAIFD